MNLGAMAAITGTFPTCQYGTNPAGITFTASGTQPTSCKWPFVQILLTGTTGIAAITNSSLTTSNCGTGLDNFYPYPLTKGLTNSTADAPGTMISPMPSNTTYMKVKRLFTA
jgi:hypothetical protein